MNAAVKQPFSATSIKRIKSIIGLQRVENIQKNLTVHTPNYVQLPLASAKDETTFQHRANKNSKRLGKLIEQIANGKEYILFNDNDFFKGYDLNKYTHPIQSIYYCRDFLMGVDFWKKQGQHAEPKVVQSADVCFTNSLYLEKYCKQWNGCTHFVGQGCETDAYNPSFTYNRPKELPETSKIVGYTGYLTSLRLDISLLENLASQLPDNTYLALIGPEDNDFSDSALHHLDNVIFTGSKKPEELPAYVAHFDVCINPQAINDITIGNYPRKIDEYLAMEKPVVATYTETMEYFSEHCSLAKNSQEFANSVMAYLQNPIHSEQQKNNRNFARNHTWTHSVNQMLQHLQLK